MKASVCNNARLLSSRQLRYQRVIRTILWFWACAAVLSLVPSKSQAARQKSPKSAAIKGKPVTPPVGKLAKPPVQRLLNKEKARPDIEPLEIREHVVQRSGRDETLQGMLNRFRIPSAEKHLWSRALLAKLGAQPLPRGKEVHFYFAKGTGNALLKSAQLMAVELDESDTMSLIWEKTGRAIVFQRLEKPYDVDIQTASAVIENSLFEDGRKAGIQPALLSQLADIFSWDLDLEKGVGTGDSVKILYEKRIRKGKDAKASMRILAAELLSTGQKHTAIYFEKQKGIGGYYDLDGRSLARNFLRFPLEFASITSQFAESRFHPILKAHMPHKGVDFAAARGTPVRAVGDGVITQAGWNGRYGKTIDLQHDSRFLSRYAHLHNFADGITNGVEVKKGQIIGYVGSTGRSTGPHLHFELYKDQQYIDPLSVDFPAEDTLEPALLRVFDSQKRTYLVELSAAPQT
jgi:murein DD-endopeptidase MepM/ murein hydrolase activator NlpD